jgi:hypothetical protein
VYPYLYEDRSQLKLRREDIAGDHMLQSQREVIDNEVGRPMILENLPCRDDIGMLGLPKDLQPDVRFVPGERTNSDHFARVLFVDGKRYGAGKIAGK